MNQHIATAAAEKSLTLTSEQIAYAERTLEAAIAAHQNRINQWIAAKMDISPDAADLKILSKARSAVRDAIRNA